MTSLFDHRLISNSGYPSETSAAIDVAYEGFSFEMHVNSRSLSPWTFVLSLLRSSCEKIWINLVVKVFAIFVGCPGLLSGWSLYLSHFLKIRRYNLSSGGVQPICINFDDKFRSF